MDLYEVGSRVLVENLDNTSDLYEVVYVSEDRSVLGLKDDEDMLHVLDLYNDNLYQRIRLW